MLSLLLRPLRQLLRILKAHDTPAQIAGGFTLGALIGWLPMGNLIAVAALLLLCSIRVSRPAGVLGAMLFVWIGAVADPFAHAIGLKLLNIGSLEEFYTALYNAPTGPWIGFNNTVVLGSLVLGVYFSFPIFWLSYWLCHVVQQHLAERARRRAVHQLVAGMNLGAPWGLAA